MEAARPALISAAACMATNGVLCVRYEDREWSLFAAAAAQA